MVIMNGFTTTPHHRQNRRRERPGSRSHRTITHKSNLRYDYNEGLLDARDPSVPLPTDKTHPSPLLRQNFDQSWQRWKARQAEEKAVDDMDKMQLELEQQRLFGGEVDDDGLHHMGILYNAEDEEITQDPESNTILCDVPIVEQSFPLYIIRHGKPRRSRRHSTCHSLPLYLSLSNLRDDTDIARLLAPSISQTLTIQHRNIIPPSPTPAQSTPQSLPTSSALEIATHGSQHLLDNKSPLTFDIDWTFINTPPYHTSHVSSTSSEPETWILLSDDLQQISLP